LERVLEGQFSPVAVVPRTLEFLIGTAGGLQGEFRNATCGTIWTKDETMRAEIQNLVEEIKQSLRLLRRHL
jgi:hypothetical protein